MHPLLPSLQSCDSPEAILAVLREQIPTFSQSQNGGDDRVTKWLTPTVNVLHAFSAATLGQGVGLVNIILAKKSCSNVLLLGIPTGKCNLCGD